MFRRLGLRSTFPSASSQNVTNWPKSSAARIKLSVLLSRPRYEIRIIRIRSCWWRILDSTRSRRLLLLLRCRHARSHYSPRPSVPAKNVISERFFDFRLRTTRQERHLQCDVGVSRLNVCGSFRQSTARRMMRRRRRHRSARIVDQDRTN